MVKRSSSRPRDTGSAVDQLQAALIHSLKESVAETVSSVCGSFQRVTEEQTTGEAADDSGGYDAYYHNCRRLVDYIQQTMEVSPGFVKQMDCIILACHSGATERVLNSVVTKQLWFHRRGDAPLPQAENAQPMRNSSHRIGSGYTRSEVKNRGKREVSVSSSPSLTRMVTRTSTELPAVHKTSVSGRKRVTSGSVNEAQSSKRQRRAATKVVHDTSDEEEESEKQEETEDMESKNQQKVRKKLQEENVDGLLPFKDAIGELCYPDRRTPAETKFFKDRLCKSIQFVDALLCKPPQGKLCGRECKKIRAQMCSSSTPCKNKMCRIWHDVEAHTDRCQNPQCEFKNRILLRETMHKLDMKGQQLTAVMAALQSKQKELKEAAGDDKDVVKNDISDLKRELKDCNRELVVLEATKKAFWGNLNAIGIKVSDDVVDSFPDFGKHYKDKKESRKAQKAVAVTAARLSSSSSRSSRAAARQTSAGSYDDDKNEKEADNGDGKSVDDTKHRRTVRRSTPSRRHSAPSRHESDKEAKAEMMSGNEEMKVEDEGVHHRDPSGPLRRNNSLLPAGSPPIRQNPEMDRVGLGYSVRSLADDFEAPMVAANIESTREVESSTPNGLPEEQLAGNMQRGRDEVSA